MAQDLIDAAERSQLVTALQQMRQDFMKQADATARRWDAVEAKLDKLPDTYITRREIDAMVAAAKPMSDQFRETVSGLREGLRDLGEKFDRFNEQAYDRYARNHERWTRENRSAEEAADAVRDDFLRYQLGQAQHANERSFTINLNTVGWALAVASIVVSILIAAHVF